MKVERVATLALMMTVVGCRMDDGGGRGGPRRVRGRDGRVGQAKQVRKPVQEVRDPPVYLTRRSTPFQPLFLRRLHGTLRDVEPRQARTVQTAGVTRTRGFLSRPGWDA